MTSSPPVTCGLHSSSSLVQAHVKDLDLDRVSCGTRHVCWHSYLFVDIVMIRLEYSVDLFQSFYFCVWLFILFHHTIFYFVASLKFSVPVHVCVGVSDTHTHTHTHTHTYIFPLHSFLVHWFQNMNILLGRNFISERPSRTLSSCSSQCLHILLRQSSFSS